MASLLMCADPPPKTAEPCPLRSKEQIRKLLKARRAVSHSLKVARLVGLIAIDLEEATDRMSKTNNGDFLCASCMGVAPDEAVLQHVESVFGSQYVVHRQFGQNNSGIASDPLYLVLRLP